MFFDVLQQLCDEKGISVSALLDSLGMSRGNMGRWKNGLDPKAGTKKKIAEALGVDRSVFDTEKPATGEGNGLGFDDFTYALHNETKKLTEENKQKLLEMAKFFQQQQELETQREKDKNN